MKKTIFYSVIFLIILGLVIGISLSRKRTVSPDKKIRESAKIKSLKGELNIQSAVINVANKTGEAIVAISTERTQKIGLRRPQFGSRRFGPRSPFEDEDPLERFFEEFFGQFPEREFKQRGLGSGFIIDKEGYILTNHHVVEGADVINITLPDGRTSVGTLKGADPVSDLAIIKINAKDLPAVELGDSDLIQVGEWVVALGNPFGYVLRSAKPTVTVGVISALHRRIPTPEGGSGYLDMIQTDAAINPGNSGGPLCDLSGKVIGINVAIFSTSGGYQGVGFAIPINTVKNILGDLIEGKEIAYGWLGVGVQEITPELAEYFNLPDKKGALVSEIAPDSPAKKAGLKTGDVVIAFNGKAVETIYDLLKEVGNAKVGQEVRIDFIRDRIKRTIKVTIGKRPPMPGLKEEKEFEVPKEAKEWRGIRVVGITDEIAQQLNLEEKEGVAVIVIDPASESYRAGLRKGDVLREINGIIIRDLADYQKVTEGVKGAALVRTDRGYFIIKEDAKKGQGR